MITINERKDVMCNTCIHTEVCRYKETLTETKYETSHPFLDIKVICKAYYQGEPKLKGDTYA